MDEKKLAVEGGAPVRTVPLPLEFPGVHHMGQEEIEAALRILHSRSLFRYYGMELQREVQALESELAAFLGIQHAVAVTSGTGALHTALAALGVGPGQEVIVPAYLWVSIVSAIVNLGAIPVLADIDETFCLAAPGLEKYLTKRTSGVVVVHMSGAPADVEPIVGFARRKGLFLLEDCAQCAGGSIKGKRVGTFGDVGIFSFQMNKNMTAGEGGAVVTNDSRLYRRAFASHDLGYARDQAGRLILDDPELCLWGAGYRLDELRAALLRVQLKKLPQIVARMRSSKYRIRKALEDFSVVQLRRVVDPEGDTGCFLLTTYPDRETAVWVNRSLRAEGILTHPQGMSNILMTDFGLHLYYNSVSLVRRASRDRAGFPWNLAENRDSHWRYDKGTCPAADDLFSRSIVLPIPSNLTEKDEEDIVTAFRKVLSQLATTRS